MRRFSRAVAMVALLSIGSAISPLIVPKASAEEISLGRYVEVISALQQTMAEGSALIEKTGVLDEKISDIYFDQAEGAGIDAAITDFDHRVTAYVATSRTAYAGLRLGVPKLASERERTVIKNALDVGEVLFGVLEETPTYLTDLLAAARAQDKEEFDRLSQRAMLRASALLRTESAMFKIQRADMDPSHPTHSLLSSVVSSNEAMALFSDAIARIFEGEDAKVEQTATEMRVLIEEMQGHITDARKNRRAMMGRLFLPSFKNAAVSDLRDVIDVEFREAIEIEVEFAEHLEAMASGLERIYDGIEEEMRAIDARTIVLTERRMAVRRKILMKLQTFADDL